MPIWKLKSKRPPSPQGSNWKPEGAGAPSFRCEFLDPAADGNGAVGADGTLRIRAEIAASYEPNRRSNATSVDYPGHGITLVRAGLRRGREMWMSGAGWVRLDPMMALRHRSVELEFTATVDDSDRASLIADGEIAAGPLGPGPVIVQLYVEGHPRELTWHRTYGWDPALAGTFSTTVTIDGETPETYVDLVETTDQGFYIIGRATDDHEVEHVLLTVIDDVTGKVLGSNHRWQNAPHSFKVPIEFPGIWSWEFPEGTALLGSGDYSFIAQAEDTAERDRTRNNKQGRGNVDPTPVRHDLAPRQP